MNDLPGGLWSIPEPPDHEPCEVCGSNESDPDDGYTEDGLPACFVHVNWIPCGHGHWFSDSDETCERCAEDAEEEEEVQP